MQQRREPHVGPHQELHRGPHRGPHRPRGGAHRDSTAEAYAALCTAEEDTEWNLTRRRFLQGAGAIGAGAALSSTMPGWAREAFAAPPVGDDEGILVVVMMGGGNDALNTVVPYTDGSYYSRRPQTAIAPDRVLPLDGAVGLHPNLTYLRTLYEQGRVAVVQGVGTHQPDLSHFVSMGNWMRGWAGSHAPTTGWLGRWLDAIGADPFHAVHLGSSVPLHLVGATRKASALGVYSPFGAETDSHWTRLYDGIANYADQSSGLGGWGDAVAASQRDHLTLAAAVADLYADPLGDGPLSPHLTLAARLINADLGARVLSVGWGDFDSHNGHRAMHDARMAEFDAALFAFWSTLSPRWFNRVTVMTFSEFGRRVPENGNLGIDHGTAGVQLLIGPQVHGGLHGQAPSLTNLVDGDYPIATVHYNEVYASVLAQWLGADPASLLGANPNQLALFASAPGAGSEGPPPGPTPPGDLIAINPSRRLDTRTGQGVGAAGPLGPGRSLDLVVAGVGDIPRDTAVAAVMNVTAVTPTEAGYLTVWPTGEAQPNASNLNFRPGDVVPNLVLAKIGQYGMVSIFNATGTTDVVADLVGYVRQGSSTTLVPVQPMRLLDTRYAAPLGPDGETALTVLGGPVPTVGVQSVVLNVTVTAPSRGSFLTVYPHGEARPWSSNLNYLAGQTVPNLVVAKVGSGGQVRFYNALGDVHVVVDLLGYVLANTAGSGHVVATSPARVLDTRVPGFGGPLAGGEERAVALAGLGGLPAGAFSGVVANVTVTEPTDHGYLTVWPAHLPRPTASNLNFGPGQSVPNLVVSAVSGDGALKLYAPFGSTHVIIDVVGYVD